MMQGHEMLARRWRNVSGCIRMWVSRLLLLTGCTCVHPQVHVSNPRFAA